MNFEFEAATREAARLFQTLLNAPFIDPSALSEMSKHEGVYLMFDRDVPVYAGRTRRFGRRIAGHRSGTRYSSTYALRLARDSWKTLHKTNQSTSTLMGIDQFKTEFAERTSWVRGLRLKFIECPETLTQYLLEAYAIVELDLDRKELATH